MCARSGPCGPIILQVWHFLVSEIETAQAQQLIFMIVSQHYQCCLGLLDRPVHVGHVQVGLRVVGLSDVG